MVSTPLDLGRALLDAKKARVLQQIEQALGVISSSLQARDNSSRVAAAQDHSKERCCLAVWLVALVVAGFVEFDKNVSARMFRFIDSPVR